MTGTVALTLFGYPRLEINGKTGKLSEKALFLLAYLVLNRERGPMLRKLVAFHLWPDSTESEACSNLRRALYEVTAAAEGCTIVCADSKWIFWSSDAAATVDVIEFERLSADASQCAAAIRLYRADLLESLECEWIALHRERLREQQISNLRAAVESCKRQHDPMGAMRVLTNLAALDPWREDIVRDMLILRFSCGDRAGALRDYALFEKRLQSELGVEPMPETLQCRSMIVRGEVPLNL